MLDVLSCISERAKYEIIQGSEDKWLERIISDETQDDVFFVVSDGFWFMAMHKQRESILKKYNIAGLFNLSTPYTHVAWKMNLIHITAQKPEFVKIAIYDEEACNIRMRRPGSDSYDWGIPDEYLPQYLKYIDKIENWVNKSITPIEDKSRQSEFNIIKTSDLDYNKLYPSYYSKTALNVRRLAKKESFVKLSDVADIMSTAIRRKPSEILSYNSKQVKILNARDFTYPLDVNSLKLGIPTKVVLRKGDILLPVVGKMGPYLFNIEADEPIYAGTTVNVIRSKSILPEYLFLYLSSDIVKQLRAMASPDGIISSTRVNALYELPVALPTQESEKYIRDFNLISNLKVKKYTDYEQLNTFQVEYSRLKEYAIDDFEHLDDILNIEIAESIRAYDEERLRSFLTDDLKELNICFKNKAYKATLILAGSILEAVLIDWLSEERGINFFERNCIVTDRRTGRRKRADLINYIDEIEDIKRPEWAAEATKAKTIKDKRNLVHAKLCMKSDVNIDEDTCRMVISYLDDVLRTRGALSNPR